ncbi:hypothetical protein HDV00_003408 [Rhizophlyctis rosea]|nr:hypothetical protein HDV00_003408 [Rhizophlyctis rosea]
MHAYNCLRVEGYIETPIPVFEMVMRVHGEKIFQGRIPVKGDNYRRHLSVALGIDPASYAKDRRTEDWIKYRQEKEPFTLQMLEKHVPGLNLGTGARGESAVHGGGEGMKKVFDAVVAATEREQKETYLFGLDYHKLHSICCRVMRKLRDDMLKYAPTLDKDDKFLTRWARVVTEIVTNKGLFVEGKPTAEQLRHHKEESLKVMRQFGQIFVEVAGAVRVQDVMYVPGVTPPTDLLQPGEEEELQAKIREQKARREAESKAAKTPKSKVITKKVQQPKIRNASSTISIGGNLPSPSTFLRATRGDRPKGVSAGQGIMMFNPEFRDSGLADLFGGSSSGYHSMYWDEPLVSRPDEEEEGRFEIVEDDELEAEDGESGSADLEESGSGASGVEVDSDTSESESSGWEVDPKVSESGSSGEEDKSAAGAEATIRRNERSPYKCFQN